MNIDNLKYILLEALNKYNQLFWILIITLIVLFAMQAIIIHKENEQNKKVTFQVAIHIGIKRFLEQLVVFITLCVIINVCIEINMWELLVEHQLIKLIFGCGVYYGMWYSRKAYKSLRFDDFLDYIEEGKYVYTSSKLELENLIIGYSASLEIIKEKLGILKALTPIPIISIVAGYVLEGKEIIINWNGCTIIFILAIVYFVWGLYDNYKKFCYIKRKYIKVEKRINRIKYNVEKEENM